MIGAPDSSPSNCELPSYVQILEYSQVLEYPWLSRVPIQGKHIQDGDVPRCAQLNKCVCVREVIKSLIQKAKNLLCFRAYCINMRGPR